MPTEPNEPANLDDDFQELVRLVELLDKAAANVRQLIYRVRPVLRAQIKSERTPSRSNGNRQRRPDDGDERD